MAKKPTAFISSTIHDFEDLRSVLRHLLEDRGYRVQLSECSDFEKPLEPNSYEACFSAIQDADVFVLLVGRRRGGWFDEAQRVSITQAEYRVAYEKAQSGTLRLINCVRRSVWDNYSLLKDIRRAGTALPEAELKLIQDPVHLCEFLEEIARVSEMKQAVAEGTALPKGNWIHTFSDFADLEGVLRLALHFEHDISTRFLLLAVRDELVECARQLAARRKNGNVACDLTELPAIVHELGIRAKDCVDGPARTVTLTQHQIAWVIG